MVLGVVSEVLSTPHYFFFFEKGFSLAQNLSSKLG